MKSQTASCKKPRPSALKAVEIFSGMSEAELLALSSKMRECSYGPGDAVFHENETGEQLFVVARGQVLIFVNSQDGEEIELLQARQGGLLRGDGYPGSSPPLGLVQGPEADHLPGARRRRFRGPPGRGAQRSGRRARAHARRGRAQARPHRRLPLADGPVGRRRPQASHHRLGYRPLQQALPRGFLRRPCGARQARGKRARLRDVRPGPLRQDERRLRRRILRPRDPRRGRVLPQGLRRRGHPRALRRRRNSASSSGEAGARESARRSARPCASSPSPSIPSSK